jgi:hypothetical protein
LINLAIRGGQSDATATSPAYGVTASVWDRASSQWVPLLGSNFTGQSGWKQQGNLALPDTLANLAIIKGSDPYLIVNIESNYAVTGSAVYVGSASLQLAKTISGGKNNGNLYLQSTAFPANNSGSGTAYYAETSSGEPVYFYASGGTPPYKFSCTSCGLNNNPSFEYLGLYKVSSSSAGSAADQVTVTDSTGATSISPVDWAAAGTALGLVTTMTSTPVNASGTPIALSLTSTIYGFGGPVSTSSSISLGYQIAGASSTGSLISGYTTTASLPSVTYQKSGQQTFIVNINAAGSLDANSMTFDGYFNVIAGGGSSQGTIQGPYNITENECVPYTVGASDSYGNFASSLSNPSLTVDLTIASADASFASFYSQADCDSSDIITTPIPIPAYNPGDPIPTKTVYFKATGTGTVGMQATPTRLATTWAETNLFKANILALAPTAPTHYVLSQLSSGPCVEVSITTENDLSIGEIPASDTVTFSTPNISTDSCSSYSSSLALSTTGATTNFWINTFGGSLSVTSDTIGLNPGNSIQISE